MLYDQKTPERVQFVVSDTGIGMSADQLKVVFDPFIQADTSTTRRYGGTGLGLALCKQYCQLAEASIHAHSQPDKGSQFYVEFATLVNQQVAGQPISGQQHSSDTTPTSSAAIWTYH